MRGGLALLALVASATVAFATPPEPEGFRGEPYRDAVPATLTGARVADTATAAALHAAHVPFVDVLPRQARPAGLPPGTVWHEKPHGSIPGAIWLPNTGYDRLNPTEEALLRDGLARVAPDPAVPLVIFCKADCWMSWNAAKRAVGWGYTAVWWYPEGTDGWAAAGLPLVTLAPAR